MYFSPLTQIPVHRDYTVLQHTTAPLGIYRTNGTNRANMVLLILTFCPSSILGTHVLTVALLLTLGVAGYVRTT